LDLNLKTNETIRYSEADDTYLGKTSTIRGKATSHAQIDSIVQDPSKLKNNKKASSK